LAALLDGQGCQKDGHEPVLPERNAEVGMARDLQHKPSVPAFVQQLVRCELADGQTAKHERPRVEAKALGCLIPVLAHELNALCLLEFLF
jgi:hypothetical protein